MTNIEDRQEISKGILFMLLMKEKRYAMEENKCK